MAVFCSYRLINFGGTSLFNILVNTVKYLTYLVPLQLFYYETVSLEGPGSMMPARGLCLSSWGEEEITEREKRERELGGYGFGEV